MNYLTPMYDCGGGWDDANIACVPNISAPGYNGSGKGMYKTYNNKKIINFSNFDDGQFVLNDGSLILVNTTTGQGKYISVDVNGFGKKPNRLGKDLFMFQLMTSGELLPMGAKGTMFSVETYCSNISTDSMNGAGCTVKVLAEH